MISDMEIDDHRQKSIQKEKKIISDGLSKRESIH